MFASLFGEELLRLMRLVLPASKINLADLVDLYLCSEEVQRYLFSIILPLAEISIVNRGLFRKEAIEVTFALS